MFDVVFDLPLHVLVVHAVVVIVPLTVLIAVAYAVGPRWRWLLRWPLLAGAGLSLATGFVAKASGDAFFARMNGPALLLEHQRLGDTLVWSLLGFFLVTVAAALLLGGPTQLADGRTRHGASAPVQLVVAAILVAASLAAGVQVVRTGHAGASAVWGTAASSNGSAAGEHGGHGG